jgi:hypothetical protein
MRSARKRVANPRSISGSDDDLSGFEAGGDPSIEMAGLKALVTGWNLLRG